MKYKKLTETAITPQMATDGAAGYDLFASNDEPIDIGPFCTEKIGTGIAAEIPKNTFGAIFPRSGLATKRGLRLANCVGVVDSDYRGEIIVALHNDTPRIQTIAPHERIAQLVLLMYGKTTWDEVEELEETERGDGGFGSTGTVERQ